MEATITETDEERAARLEAEQFEQEDRTDPALDHDVELTSDETPYGEQLAAARAREGLDPVSALPTAADDDAGAADLVVDGDGTPLLFSGFAKAIGGKKPSGSTMRLTGGAFELDGNAAYAKGSTQIFEVKAIVGEVAFRDKVDAKTSQAVDCARKHTGRIVGAVRVEASTIDRLEALQEAVRGFLAGDVKEAALAELVGARLPGA
jgi:hypothetical protein